MPGESLPRRSCFECGVSLQYEGGVRAFGRLFCSEECADDYENNDLSSREIDDLYPEWSGSLPTYLDGF